MTIRTEVFIDIGHRLEAGRLISPRPLPWPDGNPVLDSPWLIPVLVRDAHHWLQRHSVRTVIVPTPYLSRCVVVMDNVQMIVALIPVTPGAELSTDVPIEAVKEHVAVPAVAMAIVTAAATGAGVVEDVLHCNRNCNCDCDCRLRERNWSSESSMTCPSVSG